MARINIAGAVYDARVSHSGRTLSLIFSGRSIGEVAALLSGPQAQEIAELDWNGAAVRVYKNHALTHLTAEIVGGETNVCAVLQTQLLEQKEAQLLREQLDAALRRIEALGQGQQMLTDCLLEMSQTVYA